MAVLPGKSILRQKRKDMNIAVRSAPFISEINPQVNQDKSMGIKYVPNDNLWNEFEGDEGLELELVLGLALGSELVRAYPNPHSNPNPKPNPME
jgi:hypothetical protein